MASWVLMPVFISWFRIISRFVDSPLANRIRRFHRFRSRPATRTLIVYNCLLALAVYASVIWSSFDGQYYGGMNNKKQVRKEKEKEKEHEKHERKERVFVDNFSKKHTKECVLLLQFGFLMQSFNLDLDCLLEFLLLEFSE